MSLTQHVPAPPHLGTCSQCKYWCRDHAQRVAMIKAPDGTTRGVPIEAYESMRREAIKQGQTMALPKADVITTAFCARLPEWCVNPDLHWCWEFSPHLDA